MLGSSSTLLGAAAAATTEVAFGEIFIGGTFTDVSSVSRARLAAVSSDVAEAAPELKDWNPLTSSTVYSIAVDGDTVYFGGSFNTVLGTTRKGAAAVSSDTSSASPTLYTWNPNLYSDAVFEIMLSDDDIFVGGSFYIIGGVGRGRAAAYLKDPTVTTLRSWNPASNGSVYTMVFSSNIVYLGGDFTSVRSTTRNNAAAVESDTSVSSPTLYDWDPDCDDSVRVMVLSGPDMYLGGNFTTVGSDSRAGVAAVSSDVDVASDVKDWDPSCSSGGTVYDLKLNNDEDLYICGDFTTITGTARAYIAAVDSDTSVTHPTLHPWTPTANTIVYKMLLSEDGDDIYVAGNFTTIGGTSRNRIAAVASLVSDSSPTIRDWDPDSGGAVYTLAYKPPETVAPVVYLGGDFSTVGGDSHERVAVVEKDVDTTTLKSWDPDSKDTVYVMVLNGDNLYLGGDFYSVLSTIRNRAAAVSSYPTSATPTLRDWNPNVNSTVFAMVLSDDDMYIGGSFYSINSTSRSRAAAIASDVDTASPAVRSWNPGPNKTVYAMVLNGNDMYLGGAFYTVMSTTRNYAAAVDSDTSVASPTLRDWNPNCGGEVRAMALIGANLYLVGVFTTIEGTTRNHAAVVSSDVDLATPTLRDWNPNVNNTVYGITLHSDLVYLGGDFSSVVSTTRKYVAAVSGDVDMASPTLEPWNPDPNSAVRGILVGEDDTYLVGDFTAVGGVTRNRAAAFDSDTSVASPTLRDWNPNANNSIHSIVSAD